VAQRDTRSSGNLGSIRISPHKRRAVLTARGAWRIAPLCNALYRSLTLPLSVFLDFSMALRNPLNRPMRTRMSGGVAGESGRPLPLCRFWSGTVDGPTPVHVLRHPF